MVITNIASLMAEDDMSLMSGYGALTEMNICEIKQEPMENKNCNIPPPRKRQRLDHLTEEEKTLRRKIKNRVAAQSARDRKKALLENLEDENKSLGSEMKAILRKNEELLKRNEELERENEELRRRLKAQDEARETPQQQSSNQSQGQSSSLSSRVEGQTSCEGCRKKESLGHASSINVSLPQRQDSQMLITLLMMPYIGLTILYLTSCLRAYKSLMKKSQFLKMDCLVPSVEKNYQITKWWGPHQRSWNPSKNL